MPKTGGEPFHSGGVPLDRTLLDFWRWSSADLTSNTMRCIFAEYFVTCALDSPQDARVEWDAFDLVTPDGLKLEIKSAAYLQSWDQKKLSQIRFGIPPTRAFEAATNDHTGSLRRQADTYVFCLLHHQDKATVDPLDMAQWTFYLLRASVLDQRFPLQKSIGLASLLKLHPLQSAYEGLAHAVCTLTSEDQPLGEVQ